MVTVVVCPVHGWTQAHPGPFGGKYDLGDKSGPLWIWLKCGDYYSPVLKRFKNPNQLGV